MIDIISKDTVFMYNLYHITKAFFPNEEVHQKLDEGQEPLVQMKMEGGTCLSLAMKTDLSDPEKKRRVKSMITRSVYDRLCHITGRHLAWGMLTGIRPTKLIMQQMELGKNECEIFEFLRNEYDVSEEKAKLGIAIARREKELLSRLDYKNGYSLYIGIPFCPSICSYCSFSSSLASKWEDQMDEYLDALLKEIHAVAEGMKEKNLNTIYIGGGTPTTLSACQLERLFVALEQEFSLDHLLEFTVEAGRPDSITKEKLKVISNHPVTRISINPQTMQQKTLDVVGRKHTVQDVKDVFHTARELGFDNINMDLIAGLPGEKPEDMRDTLAQIEKLSPDSLTIHALAIKRAARLGQEQKEINISLDIDEMIKSGASMAEKMNLVPYYLYRQKNIAGNFENVGYAKVDKAGIYNILIMEEKQTIIATGAGATTKIVLPEKQMMENGKKSDLVRIENVKDIREYISRIDEMIERKGEWLWR